MLKKFSYTLLASILLFNASIFAACWSTKQPPETIVLQLPENSPQWKEINRVTSKDEGIIELIPLNQNAKNWSELIAIQFISTSSVTKEKSIDLDTMIACLKKQTMSSYDGNKVTWHILEKNESEVIYEWALHSQYKNIPPQHEISKLVVTNAGLHRIGFTQKNRVMSSEEKERWFTLLQKSTSIMNIEDAKKATQGLSIAKPI